MFDRDVLDDEFRRFERLAALFTSVFGGFFLFDERCSKLALLSVRRRQLSPWNGAGHLLFWISPTVFVHIHRLQ